MTPEQTVLLGTRGSRLALAQAETCTEKLHAAGLEVEIRVIKHLKLRGVTELRIANRTPERARLLAERVGGRAVPFDALVDELSEVDVVVSSTGAGDWVVRSGTVAAALDVRDEPLFFI
ncbi:MAG: hypothetical protein LC714_09630, partial [Actinobacteria bacterium]|nr:hypothetical protein [Actinomycetota bacterium]